MCLDCLETFWKVFSCNFCMKVVKMVRVAYVWGCSRIFYGKFLTRRFERVLLSTAREFSGVNLSPPFSRKHPRNLFKQNFGPLEIFKFFLSKILAFWRIFGWVGDKFANFTPGIKNPSFHWHEIILLTIQNR